MAMVDPFVTTHKAGYKWPLSKPLSIKPAEPPYKTKAKNFFESRYTEPYCHCDAYLYAPQIRRYGQLAEKEKKLHEELFLSDLDIATLAKEIADRSCENDDDKLETTYQTDYIKRGCNITQYITLMPAVESPVGVPVKGSGGGGFGIRDPTNFRYSTFSKGPIDPCPPVPSCRTPKPDYGSQPICYSEYQDTISRTGLAVIKNRQQYAQPLPSALKRFDEKCP